MTHFPAYSEPIDEGIVLPTTMTGLAAASHTIHSDRIPGRGARRGHSQTHWAGGAAAGS